MSADVEARVVGAFEHAAGIGAEERGWLQMAKASLQMFGRELVSRVADDERVALGLPVQPFVDGKSQPGVLLLLEHRALVAWSLGIRKAQTTVVEFPLDGTLQVTSSRRKTGRLSATVDAVTLVCAGQQVEFAFYSTLQKQVLTTFVVGNLDGSVTFSWDDQPSVG